MIATGKQIRNYIGSLQNRKSPVGTNKNHEDKRQRAEKEYEEFLQTKWEKIEEE